MKVKSVRELAFLFVDNEMDRDTQVAFQARIRSCPECARETRYAQHFLTVVRQRCGRRSAPLTLRQRIHEVLQQNPPH
ncbi:MAG: hypothetical protein D6696_20340 [Acidobacteria bacterium]|nr:MAG: hypothetical protein D6696_20340 [Acidobacteriota bacterium]